MPERAAFQDLQRRFAAHLRDPAANPPPPGIEPRRLKIYTELFYNNVEGFLANAFPVMRSILAPAHWHAMVRDFFARHRCRDPQFHRIAAEFLDYLEQEREASADPPYLRELAHYEWMELHLAVAPDAPPDEAVDPNGDLLRGVPVLSPLAAPLAYDFPVHRIRADYQPEAPAGQPCFLIVYRDRDDAVRFMEINPVTARLLELMQAEPASGRALLERIAAEIGHPQPEQVVAHGAEVLAGFRQRGILVGTRRAD